MTGTSCAELARQLPVQWERHHALDLDRLRLREDAQEHQVITTSMMAIHARITATEDLVLTTPAVTLADAAAQVLLAADRIANALRVEDGDGFLREAERALYSALFVVAAAAGVDVEDFAFGVYAPFTAKPDASAMQEAA